MLIGSILLHKAKTRKAIVRYLIYSLIPLVLGIIGTLLSNYATNYRIERLGRPLESYEMPPVQLERALALRTMYMGCGASVCLLAVGLLILLAKSDKPWTLDT
jgi:hypothetical protein